MSLEAKMLENIVNALAHHDQTCPMPAKAILLSSFDHERFGWDEVKGVPVQASDGIQPERFRIQCDGSANGIEEALDTLCLALKVGKGMAEVAEGKGVSQEEVEESLKQWLE